LGVSTRSCPTCHTVLPDDAAFCSLCGSATATRILGESDPGEGERGSASYESEPHRLERALGPSFELGRLIGRGGYAEVFAARDLRLKRDLAVKVLRPDLVVTPNLLARFRREAEAIAALNHPHIVPIIDVGEAGGICFILMPLVQGESLKAILAREGPLPVGEARRILLEAASALAATHAAGVVHRDIKPENIMLEGPARRVKLMDFGIAKAMDAGDRELTGTGVVVGTPQYMSPEQAAGDASVDRRTDQYSLGVVGYQMVSGRVPFAGDTARAIITRQLLEQPPRLDSLVQHLPAAFVATLHRAMEKDPRRRFETIEDFAAALRGELAPDAGLPPPDPRPGTRWGAWRWVAAAAGAVLAAVAGAAALKNAGSSASASLGPIDSTPPASLSAAPAPAPAPAPVVAPPSMRPAAEPVFQATSPPAPQAPPPTLATNRRESTGVRLPPAGVDTVSPGAAPPQLDCATAYDSREWAIALARCRIEGDSGSILANRRLAVMYDSGRGAPADPVWAARFRERAARGGHGPSAFEMGRRYELGERGVSKDPSLATEMYRLAAEAGYQPAFAMLAQRLDRGLGVPRDARAAASWYDRAASGGDPASQVALAGMYAQGRGVSRDEALAARWYREAARAGVAEAEYQLALIYFRGRGVPRSDSAGMAWLGSAASRGHADAKKELDRRKG
jgi:serine/threonine-protein kinase